MPAGPERERVGRGRPDRPLGGRQRMVGRAGSPSSRRSRRPGPLRGLPPVAGAQLRRRGCSSFHFISASSRCPVPDSLSAGRCSRQGLRQALRAASPGRQLPGGAGGASLGPASVAPPAGSGFGDRADRNASASGGSPRLRRGKLHRRFACPAQRCRELRTRSV